MLWRRAWHCLRRVCLMYLTFMHHTFLPETEKARIHGEYRLRVWIVFCLMLTVAVVVGIVSLFPSYLSAAFARQQNTSKTGSLVDSNQDKDQNKEENPKEGA